MKRSTSTGTFLLFGAPLFLMASAWWWQNREASFRHSDAGPFHLSFERAEVSKITTPSEVADGYDTQVKIVLNYNGARPQWWEKRHYIQESRLNEHDVCYSQNGKNLKIDHGGKSFGLISFPMYDEKLDRFIHTVLLPLTRVPRSDTPVIYKTTVAGSFVQQSSDGKQSGEKLAFPKVPIAIEVRGANQETVVAEVSRETLLRFVNAKVQQRKPDASYSKDSTQVTVTVQNLGKKILTTNNSITVQYAGIFDRSGKQYGESSIETSGLGFNLKNQTQTNRFRFTLRQTPPHDTPLYARFKATKDKSWPLAFSVRVRQ